MVCWCEAGLSSGHGRTSAVCVVFFKTLCSQAVIYIKYIIYISNSGMLYLSGFGQYAFSSLKD